jgi:hypothetical protein
LRYKKRIKAWNLPIHVANGLEKKMKLLHVDFGQEFDEEEVVMMGFAKERNERDEGLLLLLLLTCGGEKEGNKMRFLCLYK